MGVPVYMDIEDAYRIVQFYGESVGVRNLWETLNSMECYYDELDRQERTAYSMIKKDLASASENNV